MDENCDVFALVNFGHGPVEIRCTEVGEHENHCCKVHILPDEMPITQGEVSSQKIQVL